MNLEHKKRARETAFSMMMRALNAHEKAWVAKDRAACAKYAERVRRCEALETRIMDDILKELAQ
jgi:hypothetical protein